MERNEVIGYEALVNELKALIHRKQYHVLKAINSETINLYWEIGEEIYRQQQEKGQEPGAGPVPCMTSGFMPYGFVGRHHRRSFFMPIIRTMTNKRHPARLISRAVLKCGTS